MGADPTVNGVDASTFKADYQRRIVVQRLLDIERRGARFALLDAGRFRVNPSSVLTADDVVFLRHHRDDIRHLVAYCEQMAVAPD